MKHHRAVHPSISNIVFLVSSWLASRLMMVNRWSTTKQNVAKMVTILRSPSLLTGWTDPLPRSGVGERLDSPWLWLAGELLPDTSIFWNMKWHGQDPFCIASNPWFLRWTQTILGCWGHCLLKFDMETRGGNIKWLVKFSFEIPLCRVTLLRLHPEGNCLRTYRCHLLLMFN